MIWSSLQVVSGVLYLITGNLLHYCHRQCLQWTELTKINWWALPFQKCKFVRQHRRSSEYIPRTTDDKNEANKLIHCKMHGHANVRTSINEQDRNINNSTSVVFHVLCSTGSEQATMSQVCISYIVIFVASTLLFIYFLQEFNFSFSLLQLWPIYWKLVTHCKFYFNNHLWNV